MLSWSAFLLALGALGVGLRWYARGTDALGRSRDFPWTSCALLTALSVTAAQPALARAREEQRLSVVATALVGTASRVHCQSLGGAMTDVGGELGYVRYGADGVPEHQTLIKRDQCRLLADYLRSPARPSLNEVIAVHVLTHESMHMAGQTSEALAECEAVQRDARTARLLGASPAQAAALAAAYWRAVYPRMPDGYTTSDCGPGLSLDEGSRDAPWTAAAG